MDTEPVTERGKGLRAAMSEARWDREASAATYRACQVEEVLEGRQEGETLRVCQQRLSPDVHWSTWLKRRQRLEMRSGPAWEALLDGRVPPPSSRVREEVCAAARTLRRMNRSIGPSAAREHLVAEFGEEGAISDTTLQRIWAEAGLGYERPASSQCVPGEEREYFSGGAGLALVAAADEELGLSRALGEAALESGLQAASQQGEVESNSLGESERDELGHFTASYNKAWREGVEPGTADGRWVSDTEKRACRVLKDLSTLDHSPERLGKKLLCMGATPLLTERRGFEGLVSLPGQWLSLLDSPAYMPATLSKSLSELSLLDVGEALWGTHARQWHEVSQRWSESGPPWQRLAAYIDTTQDPYWTRHYALSGKVSRVGRVMPCLSRVALVSGPGVPLVVETYAGTVSLKQKALSLLARMDREIGEGEVGRLTIVDAEAATVEVLTALQGQGRHFVTVLKGSALKGAKSEVQGPWTTYREHDELRELDIYLSGKGAPGGGLNLRGVEMRRPASRQPKSTVFLTSTDSSELDLFGVPTTYLSRWPYQEQIFRNARNGGGLERSHGYGGQSITHMALPTKLELAESRVENAKKRFHRAQALECDLAVAAVATKDQPEETEQDAIALACKETRQANQDLGKAQAELGRLATMPRQIYQRDTGRDNITTCLKFTVLMLIEYVLKEYFGGLKMEWRRFIEELMPLPVTRLTSKSRVLYQIHANPRQEQRMAQLRLACEEINHRNLHRVGRAIRFEVIDST